MGISVPSLLIILAIVVLLFGSKRLKSLGSDLGSAIKGFKQSVGDEDKDSDFADQKKVAEKTESTAETTKATEKDKV